MKQHFTQPHFSDSSMAGVISQLTPVSPLGDRDYPTSDGRPMGETDLHRNVMIDTIETLKAHFAGQLVYVTGNLLLFYEQGNRRRHVSPDCFVVRGIPQRDRLNYLLWQETLAPNVVIEVTSASTRREDTEQKMELYRSRIGVAEYFLFDPRQEYLAPSLQGHRLEQGQYMPIVARQGRLPSEQLALHLEAAGTQLRFFDESTGAWVPTWRERCKVAEETLAEAQQAARQVEEEVNRLRRELEELRRETRNE